LQTALDNLNGVSAQVVNAGLDAWIISGAVVTVTDSLTGGQSTLQSYTGAVTSTYDSINVGYVDGFSAGQAVYYSAGNDPVIPGLTNNTVYYVVPDVSIPDAFQLAATSADALLPTPKIMAITPTATAGTSSGFGAIFDPTTAVSSTDATQLDLGYEDGFATGQAVIYSAGGGNPIGGLTNGATYYVTVVNNTNIELSTDPTNLAGTMITLNPSTASGTQHSLRVAIDPQTGVTGGATTTVSTINLGYNAGFVTGDQVFYNDGGGSNIGGLANENAYYVIVVTAGTSSTPEIIRLASSRANAMSGVYIDLDATTASGLQSLAKPFQAGPTVVGNEISVPDATVFQNGQAVVYHDGGGTPIGGLTDGTTYYVTVVDPTDITLSLTPGGPAQTLNAAVATGTDHYLSAPKHQSGLPGYRRQRGRRQGDERGPVRHGHACGGRGEACFARASRVSRASGGYFRESPAASWFHPAGSQQRSTGCRRSEFWRGGVRQRVVQRRERHHRCLHQPVYPVPCGGSFGDRG